MPPKSVKAATGSTSFEDPLEVPRPHELEPIPNEVHQLRRQQGAINVQRPPPNTEPEIQEEIERRKRGRGCSTDKNLVPSEGQRWSLNWNSKLVPYGSTATKLNHRIALIVKRPNLWPLHIKYKDQPWTAHQDTWVLLTMGMDNYVLTQQKQQGDDTGNLRSTLDIECEALNKFLGPRKVDRVRGAGVGALRVGSSANARFSNKYIGMLQDSQREMVPIAKFQKLESDYDVVRKQNEEMSAFLRRQFGFQFSPSTQTSSVEETQGESSDQTAPSTD